MGGGRVGHHRPPSVAAIADGSEGDTTLFSRARENHDRSGTRWFDAHAHGHWKRVGVQGRSGVNAFEPSCTRMATTQRTRVRQGERARAGRIEVARMGYPQKGRTKHRTDGKAVGCRKRHFKFLNPHYRRPTYATLRPSAHPRNKRFLFTFHSQQALVLHTQPFQRPSSLSRRRGFHGGVFPQTCRLTRQ